MSKMHDLTRLAGYKLVAFPALSVIRSLTLNAVFLATICMIIHLPTQAGLLSDERHSCVSLRILRE